MLNDFRKSYTTAPHFVATKITEMYLNAQRRQQQQQQPRR